MPVLGEVSLSLLERFSFMASLRREGRPVFFLSSMRGALYGESGATFTGNPELRSLGCPDSEVRLAASSLSCFRIHRSDWEMEDACKTKEVVQA